MNRSVLLSIFLALVACVIGAAYLSLPWIAGWAARGYLADNGFPDARLRVDSVGLTQATVSGIDLGAASGFRVRRVIIDYSPGRLAQGTIDGISVEQPAFPLSVGAGGVDLGALERFLTSGDPAVAPAFRLLGPLKVSAGLLSVETPLGAVDAAVEGSVLMTDGIGTEINAQFALQHPKARVSGRMRAILDAADRLQLTLDIQNANSEARVAFAELKGAVNVTGKLAGALDGGGSLTLQNVSIDGVDLGNVDLAAQVKGKAATAEFLLGGSGTGISMQIRAESDDVFDPAAVLRLYGEAATDGLKGPLALPVALDVVGALDFDISGSRRDLQALPGKVASGAVRADDGIAGSIDLTHLGLAAQNGVNATLDGRLDLAVDARGWRLRPVKGLHFDLGLPAGERDRRLDLTLDNIPNIAFLAGGPTAADPLRVGTAFGGTFNGWFPFSGDAGGSIWPATTDGVVFEDLALRFAPWQMRLGDLEVVAEQVGVRVSGPVSALDLEVAADARFAGALGDGIAVNGGHVSLAGNVGYAPDGFRIYPETCTELRASRVDIDGAILRPGPVSICPRGDKAPVLHAAMDDNGLKRIDLAAIVNSTEIALTGAGPYPLSGTLPRFDGTASFDAGRGTWWAKLSTKGGHLRAEGPDVALSDVRGTVNLEGRERLLGARIDLTAVNIMDQRRPLRFSPLTLTGKGQVQPSAISFVGTAGFADGPKADIDARYRPQDRRGALQLNMPEWRIAPDGMQPQTLLPILKGQITDVAGAVAAEARIGWTGTRTTSTATLTLDDLAFGTAPAEIAGLNGSIVFADLIGLRTDGPQTLVVGLLDAGLPLRNGGVTFDLPGTDTLHIARAHWPVAGGTLDIVDLNVPFDGAPGVIIANLKDLDAGDLARSADIEGLEADGRLAGSIPVRITADGPVIDDARIWSEKNGVLRFRSQVALESLKQSGEMADLLARALADFRYSDLQVSLDGPLSGDITAKAKINGANPALYDGKRIELNVTLQGALRDLLQSASVIQDLPGNIRDRVQGPSGKP